MNLLARLGAASLAALLGLYLGADGGIPLAKAQQDNLAGYYYPAPKVSETYKPKSRILAEANRANRVGFVTGLQALILQRPHEAKVAIIAAGAEADTIVVLGLTDRASTVYRARGIVALMDTWARLTPIVQKLNVQDIFNFYDVANMLGFKRVVISNGVDFTYEVSIE